MYSRFMFISFSFNECIIHSFIVFIFVAAVRLNQNFISLGFGCMYTYCVMCSTSQTVISNDMNNAYEMKIDNKDTQSCGFTENLHLNRGLMHFENDKCFTERREIESMCVSRYVLYV